MQIIAITTPKIILLVRFEIVELFGGTSFIFNR